MKYKNILKSAVCSVLLFSLLSGGCNVLNNSGSVQESYPQETAITDKNGNAIPVYDNVDASVLNPDDFVKDEKGRMTYSDSSVATYTGIDVSVFQGDIDWDRVAADGIDFVMLRAGYRGYGSEGKMNVDDNFIKNYEGAISAGLKVGVYFFSQATSETEAEAEAEFVLKAIKGLHISYPVAFDWESINYDTARTDGMTTAQITACANSFCEVITKAGYNSVIYFNCELGYYNYDLSSVNNYHFWLAEYYDTPSFYYDYKIWQYTEKGTVDGISSPVDLNISIVDYSDLGVG